MTDEAQGRDGHGWNLALPLEIRLPYLMPVEFCAGEGLDKGSIREILRSIDLSVEEYERLRQST